MATNGSLNTTAYENRHLAFSWVREGSSIDNNQTTISYTLKGAGSASGYYIAKNIKLVIDGKTVYTQPTDSSIQLRNGTVVTSGTVTLTHNTDGTRSFEVYVEAGIYVWAVNCTGRSSFVLEPIPRTSTLTASNGTLGSEQTLTINRSASSFVHRLTYKCGSVSGYIAGGQDSFTSGTSIKWTPRIGLAEENTTGTSVSVVLTLYTYTGAGVYIGSTSVTITCAMPVSVAPSVSVTWEDTTGAAGIYGSPVQKLSKLKITLKETTSYGSPISVRSITANGVTYNASPVTTGLLTAAGSAKISATIKDKRGRSGSNSASFDVLAYTAPRISKLTVHRCNKNGTENDQGNYVRVTFSGAVTNLKGLNDAIYSIRYRANDSAQTTEVPLPDLDDVYEVSDYSYVFPADANKTYDVEVTATDNHGSASRVTSASTAFTLMNWHPSGTGMGIGKVCEKENTMEVSLDSEFIGPVYGRAFGLGILPGIPEGADIHNYTTPGIWAIKTNAIAATIKNLPEAKAGRVIVAASIGQEDNNSKWRYIEQRYIPYDRGRFSFAWTNNLYTVGTDEWNISGWKNDGLAAYPIGSIIYRYDHTNPETLFGGHWTRITSYILRGATASGTIGETGTLADGSGRSYMNVSIWRRDE